METNNLVVEPGPIRIAFQRSGIFVAPELVQVPMDSDGLINRARLAATCLARMYRSCLIDSIPRYERDFVCFDVIPTDSTHVDATDFRRFVVWIVRMMEKWREAQDTIELSDNPAKELARSISRLRGCGKLSIRIGSSPHLVQMNAERKRACDDGDITRVELARATRLREIETPSGRILVTADFAPTMSKGDQVDKDVLATAKNVRRARAVLIGIAEHDDRSRDLLHSSDETMDHEDD